MTPEYAKERAREMARHKAYEVKQRATESNWLIPLIGAGFGALVGKAIQSRTGGDDGRRYGREDYRRGYRDFYEYPYGEYRDRAYYGREEDRWREGGFSGERTGMQEAGREESSGLAEKASEVKERVSAKADEYGERLRDETHALRERIPDREAITASAREDIGMWAFGALALGALFGMALPVSQREREMLEPAKRKVREATRQARDVALEKGSDALERAQAKIGGTEENAEERDEGSNESPIIPATTHTPLH
jgi:hypothetical protein